MTAITEHPDGPAAGDADERRAIALIGAIAQAGARLRLTGNSPQPEGPEPTRVDYRAAARSVVSAWHRASPGGRRDALAIGAQMAARLSPTPPICSPAPTDATVEAVETWVREFVALASQDLAGGARNLIAPAPWLPAPTLTGAHATSLVANTTIPEATKVVIATVLSSLSTSTIPQ